MEVNEGAFSARDYVGYVVPGSMMIVSLLLFYPDYWTYLKGETVLAAVVFLVGGFFLGYESNVIATRTICPLFLRILGNPFTSTLSGSGKTANAFFEKIVKTKLTAFYGQEVVDIGEDNLLRLCWQDIQSSEHQGVTQLTRLVTLWNFCASAFIPVFFLACAFAYTKNYVLSGLMFMAFLSLGDSRKALRREFARGVYRIWYVQHR